LQHVFANTKKSCLCTVFPQFSKHPGRNGRMGAIVEGEKNAFITHRYFPEIRRIQFPHPPGNFQEVLVHGRKVISNRKTDEQGMMRECPLVSLSFNSRQPAWLKDHYTGPSTCKNLCFPHMQDLISGNHSCNSYKKFVFNSPIFAT
jgi:hypothetical protein